MRTDGQVCVYGVRVCEREGGAAAAPLTARLPGVCSRACPEAHPGDTLRDTSAMHGRGHHTIPYAPPPTFSGLQAVSQ